MFYRGKTLSKALLNRLQSLFGKQTIFKTYEYKPQ